MVIVDTSVWSLALRRRHPDVDHTAEVNRLIAKGEATVTGMIVQELLSGVREPEQFRLTRDYLRQLPDIAPDRADHEMAAAFWNICRAAGIQGSTTDFLICALAHRHNAPIYTTDRDFTYFALHLPIQLHALT